ncbi:MAG: TRAP transporter small permease [Candidatus Adiutrix sp.]|jgi:C4-dicarboxylate transporter DctQ subunit|nr:TRAP transporter small permease [Candidatus Adiutrix sp.]
MRKIIDNFEEFFLAILLPSMCAIVFINTVGRYSGAFSIGWADEISRYMMIWLVFLGISAAAKKNAHFAVGVVFMITPKKMHIPVRAFILLLVLVFAVAATVLGYQYAMRLHSMGQTSPALNIPMWFMYGAIPVGCGLMAIRSIQHFVDQVRESRRNPDFDDTPKFDPKNVEIG